MWEDDSNEHLYEPDNFIAPLIQLLYKHDMLLALPKGIPTLQASSGNWTRPDNMWRCNTVDDPVLRSDVVPAIWPPLADHLPIITILDLPIPRSSSPPSLNFRLAKWTGINEELTYRLSTETPAKCIASREEFIQKVDDVVRITYEVLNRRKDAQPLHATVVDGGAHMA